MYGQHRPDLLHTLLHFWCLLRAHRAPHHPLRANLRGCPQSDLQDASVKGKTIHYGSAHPNISWFIPLLAQLIDQPGGATSTRRSRKWRRRVSKFYKQR